MAAFTNKSLCMTADGMYGVLLHDRENCTDSEIKSLVSQFGKLRDFRRVPKSGGDLVFIHFREFEEARACLELLGKDPMFYAVPATPREGRIPKSFFQRESARSLPRVTDTVGKKKSILRTRSLAKPDSKKESTSSDEYDERKRNDKEVRLIVRPCDMTPPRRRSYSKGLGHSSIDISLAEESSGNRPPHLLNLTDVWTEGLIEEAGIPTSSELLLFNLPTHITEGLIFAICDRVATVLSVEIRQDQFGGYPFVYAAVEVPTPNDARFLKKFLHRRALQGKVLYAVFSSDFL